MSARRENGVWVNDSNELATIIVNADGSAVSAGGGGGVSIVDDAAFTVGVSSLTVAGGVVTADDVDAGDAGAFAMLANRQQMVSLYDSSGVEITSFGGGTQYTEGATDASLTGSVLMFEGAADTVVAAPGTAANGLDVDVTRVTGTVTVDGSGVTQPVSHAALTELAGAINASAQMDVNLAASNATVTVAAHAVTNAGTFVVQENGAALTALQLIDDIVYTDDTSTHATGTSKGALIMAAATPTDTAVSANDIGAVAMTNNRALHVSVQDALPAGTSNIGDVDIASIAAGDNNIGNVDIASIAAGDNNIGNVDIVSLPAIPAGNNNIGDVDVASVVPGVAATNLGKAEDAQHTSGDVGVMALGVYQSSQADFGADGDYVPLSIDDAGGVRVSIVAGAGSGGTAAADDADFTAGTTQGTPAQGVYESSPTSVTDGDLGTLGITATRALKVNLRDASGAEVAVGGGTQYTEAATDASITGTAMLMEGAGDTLLPVQGTVAAGLLVNLGANNDVTVTGAVDLGATDNAVLDAIAASVAAVDTDTTTIIGHLDGVETLLGTIDADTSGIITAVQLLDDTVTTLGTDTYTEATSKGLTIGAVRRDADTTLVGTTNEFGPLQMDANGRLKVEAFSGETLPVSVATLPSHAVTNAGTFAVQVDGAALTALQLLDDAVYVEDVAAQAADKGLSVLAVRRDTPTALATTDNDYIQLTTNATGHLWVTGPHTVASGGIASGAIASGAVASGAVASGAFASGALAAGSIAAGAIADMIVDDAGFTPATSRVMMAGFEADETATDSVDEGDGGAARMTLTRKQIVTLQPHTAGGCTPFYNLDVDETEDAIKASAGQLYEMYLSNTGTAPLFVKLYNATTANVTVGSTTPVMTIPVPANADSDLAGVVRNWPNGLAFDTAITIAATTAAADADTGAPATGAIIVSGAYL